MRWIAPLLISIVWAALALEQAGEQGSSCETRTVLVPIVNNEWQTLTNLKAANFLVEVQHGKIEVISAQPHTAPRRIILLLDTSGSMQGRKLEIARRLAFALASSAEQHTEVSVYTFKDRLADFLGSSKDLQGLSRDLQLIAGAKGRTAMWDAILKILSEMKDPGPEIWCTC